MKKISIVTACYNEEENVEDVASRVHKVFDETLRNYDYEHIFIDNSSDDHTVEILREMAAADRRIKVIINSRNFGHIRSPYHGLIQADGDAVISIVADLQDPPEMIADFVKKWEEGFSIVIGIKKDSQESRFLFKTREIYYELLSRLSETEIYRGYTGFGLYDQKIIRILREIPDPYPFFRGLIAEIGFSVAKISYTQPARAAGVTKNNFFTLYDMGILGIINNSKLPLRLATLMGFVSAVGAFFAGFIYLLAKLFAWDFMQAGIAPILIGNFFLLGLMLFFIGLMGEYVGAIYTQVLARPRVFEMERINFDDAVDSGTAHEHLAEEVASTRQNSTS